MVSRWRVAAGAVALLVVVAILGYYLASSGSGSSNTSSNQANGGSAGGLPTTTVRLDCPPDGDVDGEIAISQTTTYTSSGTVTVQKGACVLDTDGDGR